MMKQCLSLMLGLLVAAQCLFADEIDAQMLADTSCGSNPSKIIKNRYVPLLESTLWTTILYGFEPPVMAELFTKTHDTIINSKEYAVIESQYMDLEEERMNNSIQKYYLFEDSEKRQVYIYNEYEESEQLLYDFSLSISDKMPLDTQYELKEISEITNSAYTRNQYIFVNQNNDSVVWIEGIGNYTDLINSTALKRPDIKKILCVKSGDEIIYETATFHGYRCDDISKVLQQSAIKENEESSWYITPVVTTNFIHVVGIQNIDKISICNINGMSFPVSFNDNIVDVSLFSSGMYLLMIKTVSGQTYSCKFIKE